VAAGQRHVNYPYGDLVTVERDGDQVAEVLGAFDPHELVLYLPDGTDVAKADAVGLRGSVYRADTVAEIWVNAFTGWRAGVVVHLVVLPSDAELPDTAVLERPGAPVWDRDANTQVPGWVTIWTGPVLVETPPSVSGVEALAAEQRLTLMPLLVSAPLELIDVQPDDRLTITSSADPWLVGRELEVTRVRGGSLVTLRQFSVINNQG
jgi:hypothetical protein